MITLFIILTLRRLFLSNKRKGIQTSNNIIKADKIEKVGVAFSLLFNIMTCSIMAQSYLYSINYRNDEIGQLQITRYIRDDSVKVCSMKSRAEINILFRYAIETEQQNIYHQDNLKSYYLLQKVNGRLKWEKLGVQEESGYKLSNKSTTRTIDSPDIHYTIADMYFEEPIHRNYVFSENYQEWIKIKKIKYHTYLLKFPDGNTSVYHYSNGVCKKVTVFTDWADVEFLLVNNSLTNK